MTVLISRLLPLPAGHAVRGGRLPVYVFTLIAMTSLVRSGIHLFAPDGGAGSIAGLDLPAAGANEIVFAFALWGSSQLVYAVIQLAVAFRYRSLIPAMYLLLAFEAALRILVGQMRPVHFSHTPPGAVGNYVILPLAIVMLALSVSRKNS